VFAEIRLERLDERAQADGVGEIETGVVVDGPVAGFAHAFANLDALVVGLANHLVRVERLTVGWLGDRGTEGAESGFDAGARGLLEAALFGDAGRVGLDLVARHRSARLVARDRPERACG